MPSGTHLRILKVTGFEGMKPPPYDEAILKPTSPPYSAQGPYPVGPTQTTSPYPDIGFAQSGGDMGQATAPYPQNSAPYPQHYQPSYPPAQPSYPQTYRQGQPQGYPESQPYLPQGAGQQYPYPGGATPQQIHSSPGPGTGQHAYYPPQEKQNCSVQ